MNIQTLLKDASLKLANVASNHQLEAEVLLCHTLKVARSYLYTWPQQNLQGQQLTDFNGLLQKRAQGMPLAYLLGTREFWSLPLEVNAHTLIPRAETEVLVETVLSNLGNVADCTIADLGTGTGAIALALASERPLWTIVATDISGETLAVAKRNCAKLGFNNVKFIQGDWCKPLPIHTFTAIVSNPPYIASHDSHLAQGDLPYEPRTALVAGEDGLEAIRQIILQAPVYLKPEGVLFLEHSWDQGAVVRDLLTYQGYKKITTIKDLEGNERVTWALNPP